MAGPKWGYHYEETERLGVDILFAIDTSRSMLASDIAPDRLTRAKLAVSDLVREFEGDRAGLVAFAGEAFLEVPMTTDRNVFERSLAALDTNVIPQRRDRPGRRHSRGDGGLRQRRRPEAPRSHHGRREPRRRRPRSRRRSRGGRRPDLHRRRRHPRRDDAHGPRARWPPHPRPRRKRRAGSLRPRCGDASHHRRAHRRRVRAARPQRQRPRAPLRRAPRAAAAPRRRRATAPRLPRALYVAARAGAPPAPPRAARG